MPGPALPRNSEITLIVPESIQHHSGGNFYNQQIVSSLIDLGFTIKIQSMDQVPHQSRDFGSGNDLLVVDGWLLDLISCEGDPRKKILICHGKLDVEDAKLTSFDAIVTVGADDQGVELKTIANIPPALDHFPKLNRQPKKDRYQLINVGALTPEKGQDFLIQSLLLTDKFDWDLHLIGDYRVDNDYTSSLQSTIKENNGRIGSTFTVNFPTNPSRSFSLFADLYLSCAPHESFGIAIQEALLAKVPVVNCADGYPRQEMAEEITWQIHHRCPVVLGDFIRQRVQKRDIPHSPDFKPIRTWQQVGQDWKKLIHEV